MCITKQLIRRPRALSSFPKQRSVAFWIKTHSPGVDSSAEDWKNYAALHKRARWVSISNDSREKHSQSARFARLHNSRLDGGCAVARHRRFLALQARMYTHRSTGRPLTARHKNNFETAVADIRASEKLRKKTKGKDAPAVAKERWGARKIFCLWYSRAVLTTANEPPSAEHQPFSFMPWTLANVLRDRS